MGFERVLVFVLELNLFRDSQRGIRRKGSKPVLTNKTNDLDAI